MHASVTAIGADRPGIVAAVTKVLFDQSCNLEDSRMAILGGHFAMMLVVDVPKGRSADDLAASLDEVGSELGLTINVRRIADLADHADSGAPHSLSVYGADRPGIVSEVTSALAQAEVNITDLRTHKTSAGVPVYIMLLDLEVPGDPAALEQSLKALGAERGIDLTLRPTDPETL